MLRQSHQRNGTDSNLPIIKGNKLRLGAFWLQDLLESHTQTACLIWLLQADIHEDRALMEAQISEWT